MPTRAVRKRFLEKVALASYKGGVLQGWATTWGVIQRRMWGGRYPAEEE